MMSEGYAANLRKNSNIEKRGAIGGLDLPEGRDLKEEEELPSRNAIAEKSSRIQLNHNIIDKVGNGKCTGLSNLKHIKLCLAIVITPLPLYMYIEMKGAC